MARKVGQIVRRGSSTWLVRVYTGRDSKTKRRTYLNQTIYGGLRDAQAHLNKMLGERDRGRKLDSSKQTLNRYLDRWLELCAKPRLRANLLPCLGRSTSVSADPASGERLQSRCFSGRLNLRSNA